MKTSKINNSCPLESSSDSSWDESDLPVWQLHPPKSSNTKKSTLFNSHCLNSSYSTHAPRDSILSLKQKIAQCLVIIRNKDAQIQELNDTIAKAEQTSKFQCDQIQELMQELEGKSAQLMDQKAQYQVLEASIKEFQCRINDENFDKDLLNRQVNYYKSQMQGLGTRLQQCETKVQELQKNSIKQQNESKQLQKQNARLRQDIQKLKSILIQSEKNIKITSWIENKHYISKKLVEKENWVAQDLIRSIEQFVRKHRNDITQQSSVNSLVLMVQSYATAAAKSAEARMKKKYQARIRDMQRRANYSNNPTEIRQKLSKKRPKQAIAHLRTEASFYSRHENMPTSPSTQLCTRILQQLRNKLTQEIQSRADMLSTVHVMIDWAIEAIGSVDMGRSSMKISNIVKMH